MRNVRLNLGGTLALIALLTLAGCGGGDYENAEVEDPGEGADASNEPAAPASIEVGPAGEAMLAIADAADGTTDHVVARCSGCSLGMEGSAEHVIQAGEYEMHFCSDGCQKHFVDEGEAAIIALDLTAGDDTTATD